MYQLAVVLWGLLSYALVGAAGVLAGSVFAVAIAAAGAFCVYVFQAVQLLPEPRARWVAALETGLWGAAIFLPAISLAVALGAV